MTVNSIMEMFIDSSEQKVMLYGVESQDRIYFGKFIDMPDEYINLKVLNIQNMYTMRDYITLNVNM